MRRLAAALLAIALSPSIASADPVNLTRNSSGFTYFNRPGAVIADHERDSLACFLEFSRYFRTAPATTGNGIIGMMVSGYLADTARYNFLMTNIENCMVVRGWRVVRLPEEEGASMAKLSPTDLSDRLAGWVGSQDPHGEIVRAWDNDAAKANTVYMGETMYRRHEGTSLSLQTLGDKKAPPPDPSDSSPWQGGMGVIIRPSLTPQQVEAPPAGWAIVIFTSTRHGAAPYPGVVLQREGSDPSDWRWRKAKYIKIGPRDAVPAAPEGKSSARTYAFALPPGRWYLKGMIGPVEYCLGSPFFDLHAGEVLDLGGFEFLDGQLKRDVSLEASKAFLSGAPEALQKLRPAQWTNGGVWPCETVRAAYALEFPDTPFAEGYGWGGAKAAK